MKTEVRKVLHLLNNQHKLVLESLETMKMNIDDQDFCLEVIEEILSKKAEFHSTFSTIESLLKEAV